MLICIIHQAISLRNLFCYLLYGYIAYIFVSKSGGVTVLFHGSNIHKSNRFEHILCSYKIKSKLSLHSLHGITELGTAGDSMR
jgi:hypothetical protein